MMAPSKKKPVKLKPSAEEKRLYEELLKIALLGDGIKEEVRDYKNIGKNAVYIAQRAIAGKCPCCGAEKPFAGRRKEK